MANRAGTATSTEVIPAGHAALTAEDEFGERPSETSTGLAGLSVAALGVVFGDIGTSPVYTFRECFNPEHGLPLDAEHVLGVLSMIFWALIIVVTVKYVLLIMRADNQGEGGILALLALALEKAQSERSRNLLVLLALGGAALFYGDSMITPAISVLSAVEGIGVATPALNRFVLPLTVVVLLALFLLQKGGTGRVGSIFGPVMVLWFTVIAIIGVMQIAETPRVLGALNPAHAAHIFIATPGAGFVVLGAVALAITGGEALYADMGHFGKRPIRLAWFTVVLPALVLNYFGQGALLLADPTAARNPFYSLVPGWALYPMVAVATAAAVVASQALISGAFSLTRQAVQLGYSPRVTIRHTSQTEIGQIYLPGVNRLLAVACVLLVLSFQSTNNLASAYGIAVTGTMAITTILFCCVARDRWRWPRWRVFAVGALFLTVDLAFLGANLVKIESGGWFPLLIAGGVYLLMTTWKRGRQIVAAVLRENSLPMDLFLSDIARRKPPRVPGTAVFMTSDPAGVPIVLLHHLKHNKVLHETVVIMSIEGEEFPQVPAAERATLQTLGDGFYKVVGRYGFMETPDVPALLASVERQGLRARPAETSFYLGRETLLPGGPA